MSGADVTSSVPALESDLYCGCFRDAGNRVRDLPHQAPYSYLSQIGCVRYCKSQGYDFAGIQWVQQCWCGNTGGSQGTSLTCFYVDRDNDGNTEKCSANGEGACYDGSNDCECGGADGNTLFRTSQAVSCPATIPPTDDYMGCKIDSINRDLPVLGSASSSAVAECKTICSDIGFTYCAFQLGKQCFCGNSYGNYGSASRNSKCNSLYENSVYWSGAAVAPVADLESNLYCGCYTDITGQRDLDHQAPHSDLGQKACIHYCRTKSYDFAGLQLGSECWCGNNGGTHGVATSSSCDMGD